MRKLQLLLALALVTLAGAAWLEVSCTDGATPDCTGDAAFSCGPLPNEGGSSEASTEGGSEGGTDASQNTMDATQNTVDSSDTDAGDDGGDDADAGD